jgi:hypothetical protein
MTIDLDLLLVEIGVLSTFLGLVPHLQYCRSVHPSDADPFGRNGQQLPDRLSTAAALALDTGENPGPILATCASSIIYFAMAIAILSYRFALFHVVVVNED